MLRLLKLAQLRRVWRTDVHSNIIRNLVDELETRQVILGRVFEWCDLALAYTYAEHTRRSMLFRSPRKRSRAIIVKACSIDQRLVFTQTKQTWSRITGLRMVRHSARFDKPKPERGQRLQCDTVFIQTRRQSDRIRKLQTKSLNPQRRIAVRLRK